MQDPSEPAGSSPPQHNLFLALMPDEATRAQMRRAVDALRDRHDTGGRWIDPARYHLTLHFLGSHRGLPPSLVADACRAADSVQAAPFELVLDRAGHFHRVGWLGCAQTGHPLQALWEALRDALGRVAVPVSGHAAFTPHVTVLRDARRPLPAGPIAPFAWPVHGFALFDSALDGRSAYRPLGNWPLGGWPLRAR